MRECFTFVHLSDIHFTGQSGDTCYDLDDDVRHELQRDAADFVQRVGAVTGILVTGDIAFSGSREEYVKAGSWLASFSTNVHCSEENVWVVPGNHDVDRRVIAKSVTTRMAHERLRTSSPEEIDAGLRELCDDPVTAGALFEPLRAYKEFAARFQCGISPERPFWERDLQISDGTIIRLRGLCSVLASNSSDTRGRMILGTAQASVRREDGIEYVILCHHPPDWLLDHDRVTAQLEAKVRLQLFGHKHSQRIQSINDGVRLTAGAMHPDRADREWEPMYNVLQFGRLSNGLLALRVHTRKWNKQVCRFVREDDPYTGREYFEKIWKNTVAPSRGRVPLPMPPRPEVANQEERPVSQKLDNPGPESASTSVDDPERRLTYRFLILPFRHQIAIAQSLDVLTNEDRVLTDSALFKTLFARAAENQKLAKLWEETEAHHGQNNAGVNPFAGR